MEKWRNCSFPQYFQYISNFRSKITSSGCSIYFFLNSAKMICRGMDNTKYFRMSLGLRDNESRLYFSGSFMGKCYRFFSLVLGRAHNIFYIYALSFALISALTVRLRLPFCSSPLLVRRWFLHAAFVLPSAPYHSLFRCLGKTVIRA